MNQDSQNSKYIKKSKDFSQNTNSSLHLKELRASDNLKFNEAGEPISVIQEADDESDFTTDEKFKSRSPTWGKHQTKIIPGDDEKIPFNLDEEVHKISSGTKSKQRKEDEYSLRKVARNNYKD